MRVRDAIESGNAEALKVLLNESSKVWQLSSTFMPRIVRYFGYDDLNTGLIIAAERGHAECLQVLIDAGANLNYISEESCHTALVCATDKGHKECLRILLNAGANPNYRLKGGLTPLMYAASNNDIASLLLLLNAGADINARLDDGTTALEFAATLSQSTDCVRAILQSIDGRTISPAELKRIIKIKDISAEIIKQIENVMDRNKGHENFMNYDEFGDLTEHEQNAIWENDSIRLKRLLSSRSTMWKLFSTHAPSFVRRFGYYTLQDLLYYAIDKERAECIQVLIDAGADPRIELVHAVIYLNVERLNLLINSGANINVIIKNIPDIDHDITILEYAALIAKNTDCVRAILQSPAAGNIPLHILEYIISEAQSAFPETIELIKQHFEKLASQKIQKRISDIPSITTYLNEHGSDALKIIGALKHWAKKMQDESIVCEITFDELQMQDKVDLHLGKTLENYYAVSVHAPAALTNIIKANLTRSTIPGPFGSYLVAGDREIRLKDLIQKYQDINAPSHASSFISSFKLY